MRKNNKAGNVGQVRLVAKKRDKPVFKYNGAEADGKPILEVVLPLFTIDMLVYSELDLFSEDGELIDYGSLLNYDPPELGTYVDVIHWLNEVGIAADDKESLLFGALAMLQEMLSTRQFIQTEKNFAVKKEDLSYYA